MSYSTLVAAHLNKLDRPNHADRAVEEEYYANASGPTAPGWLRRFAGSMSKPRLGRGMFPARPTQTNT